MKCKSLLSISLFFSCFQISISFMFRLLFYCQNKFLISSFLLSSLKRNLRRFKVNIYAFWNLGYIGQEGFLKFPVICSPSVAWHDIKQCIVIARDRLWGRVRHIAHYISSASWHKEYGSTTSGRGAAVLHLLVFLWQLLKYLSSSLTWPYWQLWVWMIRSLQAT